MTHFPKAISELIEQFNQLPGVGPKTAERFVFYLINQPDNILREFSEKLVELKQKIKRCNLCQNFSEQPCCDFCSDQRRDKAKICVVAYPQNIAALENAESYNGYYYVLGGLLNPLENITPERLNINSLLNRIQKESTIKEILLAFSPDLEGESTILYLTKILKKSCPTIKVTRLARGLPMGSDIDYADQVTMKNALAGRNEI